MIVTWTVWWCVVVAVLLVVEEVVVVVVVAALGGCCPCSTDTYYTGDTFFNLYCVMLSVL